MAIMVFCIFVTCNKKVIWCVLMLLQTSSTEALTLPVPSDILQIILDFLYTDECPKVTGEFLKW